VNGAAVGGGFELVLACDLAIAAHSATFAMPEVLRGQVPGGGGVFRLAQLVGIRRATELLLTGAKIGAARAAELGIVNEVVPDDTLLDRAKALAQQITRGGPLAVAGVLDSVRQPFDGSEESWWRRADELSTAIRGSADAEEGARAFVEKRAPVWTGRAQR
jgi:enoyl-CoA hydratase